MLRVRHFVIGLIAASTASTEPALHHVARAGTPALAVDPRDACECEPARRVEQEQREHCLGRAEAEKQQYSLIYGGYGVWHMGKMGR